MGLIVTLIGVAVVYLTYKNPGIFGNGVLADFGSIWVGVIVIGVGVLLFFHRKR